MVEAIETFFLGYHFRSRLEARWAVFFHEVGIAFEYERECFDFGDGLYYLPDFWLPEIGVWMEIKGVNPPEEAHIKAQRLALATSFPVAIGIGNHALSYNCLQHLYLPVASVNACYQGMDTHWCECLFCGKIGLATTLHIAEEMFCPHLRLSCSCLKNIERNLIRNSSTEKLMRASMNANDHHFDGAQALVEEEPAVRKTLSLRPLRQQDT